MLIALQIVQNVCVNPLTVQENTFQDIVDIQRKQPELSQIMVSQQARSLLLSSNSPVFYGDAIEFPAFVTALSLRSNQWLKTPVKGCIF